MIDNRLGINRLKDRRCSRRTTLRSSQQRKNEDDEANHDPDDYIAYDTLCISEELKVCQPRISEVHDLVDHKQLVHLVVDHMDIGQFESKRSVEAHVEHW